jgi:hypothetical protein
MIYKIRELISKHWVLYIVISATAIILFILRYFPEKAMGQLPIGYDVTTSYMNTMVSIKDGYNYFNPATVWTNLKSAGTFLMYAIFQVLLPLFNGNILLTLKFCGISLFILEGLAFFKMFRKITDYDIKESFYATLLFATSLATLNLSWTLFRNELGLIFFFLLVASMMDFMKKRSKMSLVLSVFYLFLIFISHEIVFLLALFFIFIFAIHLVIQKINNYIISDVILLTFCLAVTFSPLYINFGKGDLRLFVSPDNPSVVALDAKLYFVLLFSTLALFAVIGLIYDLFGKTKYAKLLLMWFFFSVFVAIEPTIFGTRSFFLWDRIILLMGIPIVILAYDGIRAIVNLKYLRIFGKDILTIILIIFINLSSFSFVFSKSGIDKDIPNNIAMPRTMIWNSVGQMDRSNFDQGATYLSNLNSPYILISDYRYSGFLSLNENKLSNAKIYYTFGGISKETMLEWHGEAMENNKEVYIFGQNELSSLVNDNSVFTTIDGFFINKVDIENINWDNFTNKNENNN